MRNMRKMDDICYQCIKHKNLNKQCKCGELINGSNRYCVYEEEADICIVICKKCKSFVLAVNADKECELSA